MRSAVRGQRDALRSAQTAPARWSPLDFVGRMTAVVAVLPVARAAAQAMLPAGLGLAAQEHLQGDRHPLVLILGQQSNVRPRPLPLGADYLEFILAVPFVEQEGCPPHGPFCYCPRLYLDRRLPTIVGRLLYGYAKRRAAIRMTERSYRIADLAQGGLLLSAAFDCAQPAAAGCWRGAAALLDLTVISQAGRGWWYSSADLGLDRALAQPVDLALTIHRPFVSGLPVGEFRIAGVDADGAAAFRVRTSWRLAGPWARRTPPWTSGGPASDPSERPEAPGQPRARGSRGGQDGGGTRGA